MPRPPSAWLGAFALAALLLTGAPALAEEPCTLMEVTEQAELVVFFTKFPKEDQTGGRYAKCRRVKKKVVGTITYRVTPFRPDATVVVHPANWPK